MTGLVFLISIPHRAGSEDFEGETALIKKLTPQEMFTYFGTQYLMSKYQKKQFLSLETGRDREEWIERFWIDLDPTPATDINERKLEHGERVKLARKHFGMKKAPGWDKRGEILIRFGMPAYRQKTWANISFYSETWPGEVWYYESLDMLVYFQDFNLKGEFIFPITPYSLSGRARLDKVKDMIEHVRNNASQHIYMNAEDIRGIMSFNPDKIDYMADRDIRMSSPKDLIASFESEKLARSANNFYKYMKEKPTLYSFELDRDPLPFYFDVTSFKAGPGMIRSEVNFEIPTSELIFIKREGALRADVEIKVLVRDYRLKRTAAAEDIIRAAQTGSETFKGPSHIPGQVILTLEPGYYRMGIQATDLNSGRNGAFKTNLELGSLDGALKLSDIQFASRINEAGNNPKFLKGNLQVVPHPLHAYRIPYPLAIYFEIYGLDTNDEDIAFYTIEYRIIPREKRRKGPVLEEIPAAISSKFEMTGLGSTQMQRLSIATENLWKGSFELVVSVKDRRTLESAEQKTRFSVLE